MAAPAPTPLLTLRDLSSLRPKSELVFEKVVSVKPGADEQGGGALTLENLRDLSAWRRRVGDDSPEGSKSSSFSPLSLQRSPPPSGTGSGTSSPAKGSREAAWATLVQHLERYLALLANLVARTEGASASISVEPRTDVSWRSVLCGARPRYFSMPGSLPFEQAMAMQLYAGALMEQAAVALKEGCADCMAAASLFKKAAGAYDALMASPLPQLQPILPPDRCPEVVLAMAEVLKCVALAQAQVMAARRAEEKGSSPSLLAKLLSGVVSLFDKAATTLRDNTGQFNDVAPRLKHFLHLGTMLYYAQALTCMGQDEMARDQHGIALGCLRKALTKLQGAADYAEGDPEWKQVWGSATTHVTGIYEKCEKENGMIFYQKEQEAPPLPEAKVVVASTAFLSNVTFPVLQQNLFL
eukprot:jgi/Mesvir1/21765/Mv04168-RA.1